MIVTPVYFSQENFYLFNMFYKKISTKDFFQITHLFLIAKDKTLKIVYDDCIRWPYSYYYYSQSLLSVQFTKKNLLNLGFNTGLITAFSHFL